MQLKFTQVETNEQEKQVAVLGKEIWHECYAHIISAAQINYMLNKFQSEKAVKSQLNEGYKYYLLKNAEGLLGYIGFIHEKKENKLFLSKIYLLKKFRGRGFAKEAFNFITDYSKKNACFNIWLTVNRNNKQAVSAYEKMGFKILRTQDVDIGGGFLMEDYVMSVMLPRN